MSHRTDFDDLVRRRLSFDSNLNQPCIGCAHTCNSCAHRAHLELPEDSIVETGEPNQDEESDESLTFNCDTRQDAYIDGAFPPSLALDAPASCDDKALDRRCISNWQQVLSLLTVIGTNRFTLVQFDYFQDTVS